MAPFISSASGSRPRISWSEVIWASSVARRASAESAISGHRLTNVSSCGAKMMDPCCNMEEACQVWALPTNFFCWWTMEPNVPRRKQMSICGGLMTPRPILASIPNRRKPDNRPSHIKR